MHRCFLFCFLITFISCDDTRQFYVSPDGVQTITVYRVEEKNSLRTSFVLAYGKYEKVELPISYVKVRDRYREGWECIIKWNSNSITVYQPYGLFVGHNIEGSKIELLDINDRKFYDLYFDKSNEWKYTKISASDFD